MVEDLGALNAWVSLNFPSLEVKERRDGCGSSFLSVTSRSCHPVLMTLPSVQLNIFVQVSLYFIKVERNFGALHLGLVDNCYRFPS